MDAEARKVSKCGYPWERMTSAPLYGARKEKGWRAGKWAWKRMTSAPCTARGKKKDGQPASGPPPLQDPTSRRAY